MLVPFGPEGVVYSDGTIARARPINVYVSGTNTLASLWRDLAGLQVETNPVYTDAQGNLRFFANAGAYDLEAQGFRVTITLIDESSVGGAMEWNQTSPSAQWTIPHTLGRVPAVEVYVGGKLVGVDVDADASNVIVTFPSPQSGVAVLA